VPPWPSARDGRRRRRRSRPSLLDQERLAGVGNLLADEILWRAGLDRADAPRCTDGELRALHKQLRATLRQLGRRGGSHMGELMEQRAADGRCPLDGTELRRETVGGRTTYWCPAHQNSTAITAALCVVSQALADSREVRAVPPPIRA
jgi:formamidopyrimidine-DNA glycosylase